MQPHQQRVVDESKELNTKFEALNKFISENDTYKKLPDGEKELLVKQSRVMGEYLAILNERIRAF